MRFRSAAWLVLSILALSAFVTPVAAKPSDVKITTDNPEINQLIESGELVVSVYEEPSNARKRLLNTELKELGYSEELIAKLPWPLKEYNVTHKLRPEQATRSALKKSATTNSGDVSTQALNDSSMDWSHWGINQTTATDTETLVGLYGNFDWNHRPTMLLTDKIGWNWLSDAGDTWVPKSVIVRAYHYACIPNSTTCKTFLVQSTTPRTESGVNGIAVAYDLITRWSDGGVFPYDTDDIYGTATTILRRPKNGGTEVRQLVYDSEYAHKQGTCSFELTFSNPPGIAVSCGWMHDITESLNGYVDYNP